LTELTTTRVLKFDKCDSNSVAKIGRYDVYNDSDAKCSQSVCRTPTQEYNITFTNGTKIMITIHFPIRRLERKDSMKWKLRI